MSDDYLDPYREAVDRFGATFDATLWNSREFQRLRFEVLRGMVDLDGLTLLDAGCGLGDLCEHLRERNVQLARYVGVDGVPEIVEAAKRRQLPHAEFHCRDFVADAEALRLGRADVIFFSGSLNTLPEETARLAAQRAWEAAGRGIVFNFLSDRPSDPWRDRDTGPARRFNTLDWLDWALGVTSQVRFRQDYLAGHDATIAMLRPPTAER